MRLVFIGSGAFGLPTLHALALLHDITLVITQPDKPARRGRQLTPTPIGEFARLRGFPILTPDNINDPVVVEAIGTARPDATVVIAYGQKIGAEIRSVAPTINLHGSLLPKYRGAAPINWAVIHGEKQTGISVIDVADRMDAGDIYGAIPVESNPAETAGELHDRLADLGPELMLQVLDEIRTATAAPQLQDDALATAAPKLSKQQGTVRFDQPADRVRAWVHGLTPWPGCTVCLGEQALKLLRVDVVVAPPGMEGKPPGTIVDDGIVVCRQSAVQLLMVQPPGARPMDFQSYTHGHGSLRGQQLSPMHVEPES